MAKGWNGEYERHAMARMGIKTGRKTYLPTTLKREYKNPIKAPSYEPNIPSGGRLFKLKNGVVVVAWWEKTRNAFRHLAVAYQWDGVKWNEVYRTKIPYQNRTWESYEYQSVLQKAIDGINSNEIVLTPVEKKKAQEFTTTGVEKQEHERVQKEFGRIGAIAQMGELFGSTKKEKNDWKERMLKAGLGDKGLQMPEDWDVLSEDEKEKRLNNVVSFLKEKK